ncbi:MAG: L,D-transpeptidase [Chitinophagaceae bacterium]|nr:L,D-transpeptidase [Chitinophagaceae bacterium]
MKGSTFFQIVFLSSLLASLSFISPVKKKRNSSKKTSVTKPVKPPAKDSIENPYYIIVDKSDYELKVYDDEGWYATYPIVFGSKDLGDKMKEGDKRTPDGNFKVILKKIHPQWGPELLLDYPNDISYQKFKERKSRGLIPKNARIGNGIAIHATRPQEEWTIDNFYNWTDGCVSVKYTEMKDLFSYIPVGTPVTIQQ